MSLISNPAILWPFILEKKPSTGQFQVVQLCLNSFQKLSRESNTDIHRTHFMCTSRNILIVDVDDDDNTHNNNNNNNYLGWE